MVVVIGDGRWWMMDGGCHHAMYAIMHNALHDRTSCAVQMTPYFVCCRGSSQSNAAASGYGPPGTKVAQGYLR